MSAPVRTTTRPRATAPPPTTVQTRLSSPNSESHERALQGASVAGNLTLAAFPVAVRDEVLRDARPVTFATGEVLRPAGPVSDSVVFPLTLQFSAVLEMSDGLSGELFSMGREGAAGLPALVGAGLSGGRLLVTIPGEALLIPVEPLKGYARDYPEMQAAIIRAVVLQMSMMSRIAACNGRHSAEQRVARWLLTADDRMESERFSVRHATIADLLGIRRPTASSAVSALAKRGLVAQGRESVRLLDRAGLGAVACACYPEFRRLLLTTASPAAQSHSIGTEPLDLHG